MPHPTPTLPLCSIQHVCNVQGTLTWPHPTLTLQIRSKKATSCHGRAAVGVQLQGSILVFLWPRWGEFSWNWRARLFQTLPHVIVSTCCECLIEVLEKIRVLWNFMSAEGILDFILVLHFWKHFALPFWYHYTFPIFRDLYGPTGSLKLYDWQFLPNELIVVTATATNKYTNKST